MEPITRQEKFLAKAAGRDVTTPKPITRTEMFLQAIIDNGGPGGGATTWEDLGSTFEEGTVLAETNPVFVEDEGTFYLTDTVQPLIVGKEYTVNWNGTEYSCVAEEYSEDGVVVGAMLGNTSIVGGTQENEIPFVVVAPFEAIGGMTGMIAPLDGSTELTLSITGEVEKITPVPEKYLPTDISTVKKAVFTDLASLVEWARVEHNIVKGVLAISNTHMVYLNHTQAPSDDGVLLRLYEKRFNYSGTNDWNDVTDIYELYETALVLKTIFLMCSLGNNNIIGDGNPSEIIWSDTLSQGTLTLWYVE